MFQTMHSVVLILALLQLGEIQGGPLDEVLNESEGAELCSRAEVRELQERMQNHSQEVTQLLTQYLSAITRLQEKVDRVEGKVDRVEGKVDRAEGKADRVEEASNNHNREVNQSLTEMATNLDAITALVTPGTTFANPVLSCSYIQQYRSSSQSGMYWIQSTRNRVATLEYCDMTRECCGSRGGWMRVAHLDMTDPNQHCPPGFREITSPRRMCGRPGPSGCVSTTFPVHGVEYRKVCGKVNGYQYRIPDAFQTGTDSIDSHYVDGVSITHGQSPRKHIWTFVTASDESRGDRYVCPCTRPDLTYTGTFPIPSFVGQDYFCETGSRPRPQARYYTEDPLWDGRGCGPSSTCCSFNNPPWFCKELPQPTTDDIELRICANENIHDEDSPVDLVELYVQ